MSASVGCSAGLDLFPSEQEQPDVLLRYADEALYVAKRSKKTRARFWVNHRDITNPDQTAAG
ncbi:hypothetical protein [Acidithiobacillus sp.]